MWINYNVTLFYKYQHAGTAYGYSPFGSIQFIKCMLWQMATDLKSVLIRQYEPVVDACP